MTNDSRHFKIVSHDGHSITIVHSVEELTTHLVRLNAQNRVYQVMPMEDPLENDLEELARQKSTDVRTLIMSAAYEESPETDAVIRKHVGYVSDSVIDDLLEQYAPEALKE